MISFIWSDNLPLYTGRGGTETFTIGHVRELNSRGVPAQVLTLGLGENDGRQYYKDILFKNLDSPKELSDIDDVVVYVNFPYNVPTKHRSFVFFHYPPLDRRNRVINYKARLGNSAIITNSRYMRRVWAKYLDKNPYRLSYVYPFADPVFSKVERPQKKSKATKVLFAGRLLHDKGIYLFMEALHHNIMQEGFEFTVTTAGNQSEDGQMVEKLVKCHPMIKLIPAKHSPEEMAELYAEHDIVVVPSNSHYWHEAFGMISVEAQHAGCRTIVTNADGLKETNCGGLIKFKPSDSYDLAQKILHAKNLGPVSKADRVKYSKKFTRKQSVDNLLAVIDREIPGPLLRVKKTQLPKYIYKKVIKK